MAYTVISIFPATADTEEIRKNLTDHGFNEANIIVSKSKLENESSPDDYEEDVKTKSFWNFIFANDTEMLNSYSTQSVGKNNIIVYADTFEDAEKANTILNENGAVEVYRKQQENEEHAPEGMSEKTYKGIIAKAKNDLYFLDSERVYSPKSKGMDDTMDDLGSKD